MAQSIEVRQEYFAAAEEPLCFLSLHQCGKTAPLRADTALLHVQPLGLQKHNE